MEPPPGEKPHFSTILLGHRDAGKAALMARLRLDANGFTPAEQKQKREAASRVSTASMSLSSGPVFTNEPTWNPRTHLSIGRFESQTRIWSLMVSRGYKRFLKNIIAGLWTVDVAILVVSAISGEFEAGASPDGQTNLHPTLAFILGKKQHLIVAVNKMDRAAVNWSQERFQELKSRFCRSTNMPWYAGPTLVQALDCLPAPTRDPTQPLLLSVLGVHYIKGVGVVPHAVIRSGTLAVGDRVSISPSGAVATVQAIGFQKRLVSRAAAGDYVAFTLSGPAAEQIRRGCLVTPHDAPAPLAFSFIARILLLRSGPVFAGYSPLVFCHTAHTVCRFCEFIALLDRLTHKEIEKDPKELKRGDMALVRLVPLRPLYVEKSESSESVHPFGHLVILDNRKVAALGRVVEIEYMREKSWRLTPVPGGSSE